MVWPLFARLRPRLSRFVPFCPPLSPFVPFCPSYACDLLLAFREFGAVRQFLVPFLPECPHDGEKSRLILDSLAKA